MPHKSHDDLSEMLSELAESQKRQEAELHELAGGSHNPPPLKVDDDEPIDALLAEETTKLEHEPGEAAAAEVEAEPEIEPVEEQAAEEQAQHRPVDDLIAIQDEDAAASADMLAALAAETGGAPPEEAAQEEEPAPPISPQVLMAGAADDARETPAPRPAARRTRPGRTPAKPDANLKAVFAPVLLTMGVLMLLPAVWGVMILMGAEVWMHDGQDVDTMAKIMLICWPVALGLLAGAFVSFVQISREKAKQREREAAMSRRRGG